MLRSFRTRPLLVALLLGLVAQLLFGWQLGRPGKLNFDEVHYVPAARALLALSGPVNIEHPLLAKELIAAGMAVFGDNPIGWRAAATLAGSATVMGVFAVLWLVFGRLRVAAFGALLAMFNGFVFVHARTAMLEAFLGAFVTLGIAAMLWAMHAPPGRSRRRLLLAAVLLGAAVAVKWAAAPYVAFAILAFLLTRDGGRRWPDTGAAAGVLILGLGSIASYFLTFAPAFFYAQDAMTLAKLLPFQWEMYVRQTQVLPAHPYQSSWWTWPLTLRPIWFFYEPEGGAQRGVLLVGNPAVMWGGLVAVAACLWAGWRDRSARLAGIGLLWVASLLIWAAIPKSLGFYYYYHLSAIFLCIALPAACWRYGRGRLARIDAWVAVAAVACAVHFYPIWSAAALDGPMGFQRWMWLDSWR